MSVNSAIVYLSGPYRGNTIWLKGDELRVGRNTEHDLRLPYRHDSSQPDDIGSLRRRGESYELIVSPGAQVWVNGESVESIVLLNGDVLELDEGVVMRFRSYRHFRGAHKSMFDALWDCLDCARQEQGNFLKKTWVFLASGAREFVSQISPLTRNGVLLFMIAMTVALGVLWHEHTQLQQHMAREEARLEKLRAVIDDFSHGMTFDTEALDSKAGQTELESIQSRLQRLESQAAAPTRIIEHASAAVLLVAQVYEFVNTENGKLLREKGREGNLLNPGISERQLTLEEDYPPARVSYLGTAFFIDRNGRLLTNRHVATPLLYEERAAELCRYGYRPVRRHFAGFGHGGNDRLELEVLAISENTDLAMLGLREPVTSDYPALELGSNNPQSGDGVILIGFPTGIRALLARSEQEDIQSFVDDVQGFPTLWKLLLRIADEELIHPLATQGIVGHVGETALVYDAQTAQGGSGGPVLDLDGSVVGVNRAVVPEFGGSNIGVPLDEVLRFLEESADQRQTRTGQVDEVYAPAHPCVQPGSRND